MAYDWTCNATVSIEHTIGTPTIVDGYVIDNGIETYGESYGSLIAKDGEHIVCQIDFQLDGLDSDYMELMLKDYYQAKRTETHVINVSHDFDDLIADIEDFYDNDIVEYPSVYQVTNILVDMLKDAVYEATPPDSTEVNTTVIVQPPID